MSSELIPIKAFKDNYIWTYFSVDKKSCWVVDPGVSDPVINFLNENRLSLSGILLTHHHYDHSGGIKKLQEYYPNIEIIGSINSPIPEITKRVLDGEELQCGSLKWKILEIPGHTLDHIAYYNDEMLLSGDTLFSGGCGRVFEGTYQEMYASLNKLRQLPSKLKMYCGHEYTDANLKFAQLVEPDNADLLLKIKQINLLTKENKPTLPAILGEEKKYNPFLRCETSGVINAIQKYSNGNVNDPIQVFTLLREWKNSL